MLCWDGLPLAHDSALADDGPPADGSPIRDHGAHADDGIVVDGGVVNDRSVADGDPVPDARFLAGPGVDDAIILDAGAAPDGDGPIVATDAGARSYPAIVPNGDVTKDIGRRVDVGTRADGGRPVSKMGYRP
jgi:hypothetical protein